MKPAQLVVRPGKKSDLSSIRLHYGSLDTLGDPFCDVRRVRNVRFAWLLVAEVAGEYAGFLYWHIGKKPFFMHGVAKFAHIREVQVLKKFQGRGVGKRLTIEALNRLRALGIQDVFLATDETNRVARHLYTSLGFRPFRKQIQYRLERESADF